MQAKCQDCCDSEEMMLVIARSRKTGPKMDTREGCITTKDVSKSIIFNGELISSLASLCIAILLFFLLSSFLKQDFEPFLRFLCFLPFPVKLFISNRVNRFHNKKFLSSVFCLTETLCVSSRWLKQYSTWLHNICISKGFKISEMKIFWNSKWSPRNLN